MHRMVRGYFWPEIAMEIRTEGVRLRHPRMVNWNEFRRQISVEDAGCAKLRLRKSGRLDAA